MHAVELGNDQIDELKRRGLAVPGYDPDHLRPRIVHIGVGGFHRAHLAVYCHHLAEQGADWGICGVGLLPGDSAMAEALGAQDHLYTFTKKGSELRETEVIGSIVDYVLAADDHDAAAARIADPIAAIVSMTVTEAGYDDTERNRTTFDVIAAGLDRRRTDGLGGVTIMSCDNLPGNGDAARRCVSAACERRDPALSEWVDENCSFPNSMVDRITPVTADEDRAHLLETFGVIDRWPVVGEPFWQWVLEDDFAAGRPDFAAVGALYTDDVHAWELYKLRLLNAGHSAIAYLGALAGITYVDEALATDAVRSFLERFLYTEAAPTLDEISGHPREDYARIVIERFSNTGVRDQIARLCIDGTSKFPKFVMPTVAAQLRDDGPVACSAHALAGWAHYLSGTPRDELAHDSMLDRTLPRALAARDEPAAFLDDNPAFPPEVANHPRFRDEFTSAYRSIGDDGALNALRALTGG